MKNCLLCEPYNGVGVAVQAARGLCMGKILNCVKYMVGLHVLDKHICSVIIGDVA